jgi:hypothetical protein
MSFNNEDVIWVNQGLMSYKDKRYHSDGYFEINVTSTTKDYINFSQPRLSLVIDNEGKRRIASLSLTNVLELLNSFNEVSKNIKEVYQNPNQGDITKRFNKNKDLIFEYRVEQNTKEPLVIIKISFGYSDEGKVIVPYSLEYMVIGKLLRSFYENYSSWCVNLPMRYLASQQLIESKLQTTLIKTLPSQIIPVESTLEVRPDDFATWSPKVSTSKMATLQPLENAAPEKTNEVQLEVSNEEFDAFVKTEEPKVVIPELESTKVDTDEKPKTQEFKSKFINEILKGDIKEYETLMTASLSTDNPLEAILKTIDPDYSTDNNMSLLPSLSDIDLKSALYIQNVFFKTHFHSLVNNGDCLPISVPFVKYKPAQMFDENKELAYDLCMINCYLKSYRSRRENTNPDNYTNGALTYFISRCYLDIVTYSFLEGNKDIVKSCIVSRFNYFKEKGFFNYFDELLKDNNCTEISGYEIEEMLEFILSAIPNESDISEVHINTYDNGSFKAPPKNKFTIEQILNDVVNTEVKFKYGKKIEDLTENPDIIELFKKSKKKKTKPKEEKTMSLDKEKVNQETNLLRWIKFKIDEVPEKKQKKFLKHIEELGLDSDYAFSNNSFQEDEFGENIVKGLYVWNSNPEKKIRYTEFAVQIEECISKDLILSKLKETENLEDTTGSENGNWV